MPLNVVYYSILWQKCRLNGFSPLSSVFPVLHFCHTHCCFLFFNCSAELFQKYFMVFYVSAILYTMFFSSFCPPWQFCRSFLHFCHIHSAFFSFTVCFYKICSHIFYYGRNVDVLFLSILLFCPFYLLPCQFYLHFCRLYLLRLHVRVTSFSTFPAFFVYYFCRIYLPYLPFLSTFMPWLKSDFPLFHSIFLTCNIN